MVFTSQLGAHGDLGRLGGKAGHLAALSRQGLPIPPGFVVEAAAFDALFPAGAWPAPAAAGEAVLAVALPAGLREELVLRAGALTPPWIVRSSALGEDSGQASFAGQLDSIFPVSTVDELETALKRCWASYFSPRCLAYQASGRGRLTGMAVLVQELISPRFAGVLFTRSPAPSRGLGAMLGEYCLGHGEALVAGHVDPGRFTLDRASLTLVHEERLAEVPADTSLVELGRLAQRCEELLGGPQDIEWALAHDGALFLVQARPLTTPLPALPTGAQVVWSNANVAENFPSVLSPLLYSVAAAGYRHYFRNLAAAFGVSAARRRRLEPAFAQIIGVHAGRMYYHLSHIHQILRGVPGGEFLARSFDDFVGAEGAAEVDPPPPTRLWEIAKMGLAVTRQYSRLRRRVAAFEARIEAYCQAWPIAELEGRGAAAWRRALRELLEIRCHRWNDAALADAAAMVCYGALGRWLKRLRPQDPGWLHDLLKGLPALVSGHPPRDLAIIADRWRGDPAVQRLFAEKTSEEIWVALKQDGVAPQLEQELDTYLARWGFRCSGELMLTVPGLDERPAAVVDLLRAYLRQEGPSATALLEEQRRARLARTAELLAVLPWYQRPAMRALIRATHVAVELRERARLQQARLYNRLRHLALAIGRDWVRGGQLEQVDDIFCFSAPELDEWLAGGALFAQRTAQVARERRQILEELAQQAPPDHFRLPVGMSWQPGLAVGGELARGELASQERLEDPTLAHWVGVGASSGQARGKPRVLREVLEASQLQAGEILVTRQTDPGWAAVFPLIRGLVLERGGLLSHGAIIAREYGIPCVVGIRRATELAAACRELVVDGDRGTVDGLR